MSLNRIKHQDFSTSYSIAQRFSDYCDSDGVEVPAKILAKLSEFLSMNILEIQVASAITNQERLQVNEDILKLKREEMAANMAKFIMANRKQFIRSLKLPVDNGPDEILKDTMRVFKV